MTETQRHTASSHAHDDIPQIIKRCLNGDQASYAELYRCFAAGTYRLCYSLLLNQQDAEDVTQEAFVYAFRNLMRYDARKSAFKTWLYTIAVSRCRNHYRRRRFATIALGDIIQLNIPAPNEETPEAAHAYRAACEAIEEALGELSPEQREAIVLRYGHGLTYREVAEIMDCPAKTAESRVRLAQNHLRSVLQPTGRALLEELLRV